MKKIAVALLISLIFISFSLTYSENFKNKNCQEACPYCKSPAQFLGTLPQELKVIDRTGSEIILFTQIYTCPHRHLWECWCGDETVAGIPLCLTGN